MKMPAKMPTYRSVGGCCICGAKSSSSRFTSSDRYEVHFGPCFNVPVSKPRTGDICNACVLIVKRFREDKSGMPKSWAHVLDARRGPGLKSMTRIKKQRAELLHQPPQEQQTAVELTRSQLRKNKSKSHCISLPPKKSDATGFIDMDYWTRRSVCCGSIYCGPGNRDCLIDVNLFHPCDHHQHHPNSPFKFVVESAPCSPPDLTSCPSSSVDSGNASPCSANGYAYSPAVDTGLELCEEDESSDLEEHCDLDEMSTSDELSEYEESRGSFHTTSVGVSSSLHRDALSRWASGSK